MRNSTHVPLFVGVLTIILTGCASSLTTKEKGGLIGASVGARSGAIIGSTVGHAAADAFIGGQVGPIAVALIGDQFKEQERH